MKFELLSAAQTKGQKRKAERELQVNKLRPRPPIDYGDKEDYKGEEDYEETKRVLWEEDEKSRLSEIEDSDFVPTAERWEFALRLTAARMAVRLRPVNPHPLIKNVAHTIAGPIEGERKKNCGITVGFALGLKSISAWAVSRMMGNAIGKKWELGNKDTAEWCHLAGISLGGSTVAGNLVAASFCANTYMGVIEKAVQGRTDLQILVTVEGMNPGASANDGADHVADWINYAVVSATNPTNVLCRFEIDARISAFSREDANDAERMVKAAILKRS